MTKSVLTKLSTLLFAMSLALFGAVAFAGTASAEQCDGPSAASNPNCGINGPGAGGSNGPGDHNDENGNNDVSGKHGNSAENANPNADCNALGEGRCTTPVVVPCQYDETIAADDAKCKAPVDPENPGDPTVTTTTGGSTPEEQAATEAAAVLAATAEAPTAVSAPEAATVAKPAKKPAKVNAPAAATVPTAVPAGDGSSLPQTPMVALLVLAAAAATAAGAGMRLMGSNR